MTAADSSCGPHFVWVGWLHTFCVGGLVTYFLCGWVGYILFVWVGWLHTFCVGGLVTYFLCGWVGYILFVWVGWLHTFCVGGSVTYFLCGWVGYILLFCKIQCSLVPARRWIKMDERFSSTSSWYRRTVYPTCFSQPRSAHFIGTFVFCSTQALCSLS